MLSKRSPVVPIVSLALSVGLLVLARPPASALDLLPPGTSSLPPLTLGTVYTFSNISNRSILVNGQPAVVGAQYRSYDIVEVDATSSSPGSFTVVSQTSAGNAAVATSLTSDGLTTMDGMWNDLMAIWIDEYQAPPIPRSWQLPGTGLMAIWIDE